MSLQKPPTAVPETLAEWMKTRTDLLGSELRRARAAERDYGDLREWELDLLQSLSNIEAVARRAVHLLTAHSIRNKVLTATEVAAATNVTTSTAMNRNGSGLAQEVLNELASLSTDRK